VIVRSSKLYEGFLRKISNVLSKSSFIGSVFGEAITQSEGAGIFLYNVVSNVFVLLDIFMSSKDESVVIVARSIYFHQDLLANHCSQIGLSWHQLRSETYSVRLRTS